MAKAASASAINSPPQLLIYKRKDAKKIGCVIRPRTGRSWPNLQTAYDLSVAEIAVALDVPPGTVKTRLMHARRKIRARLEGSTDEQD